MHVLLVGKGPPERGGIPTFLVTLERGLTARGDDVRLLNLTRPADPRQGGAATVANLRRTVVDLVRVLRAAGSVDVVHVHSAGAPLVTFLRAVALALAGRLRGAATVLHVHGGLVERWLVARWQRLLVRVLLRVPHRTVTVADGTRAALVGAGVDRTRTATVRNGIETSRFTDGEGPARDPRPPTVLYVGLLTPRKGVLDLFAASSMLRDRSIAHRLRLVGGTPDEGAHAEAEVRNAAPDWAELAGSVPYERIAQEYLAADLFCLPSWWEAMPLTVLEAKAAGLPVVATDVGDVRVLVRDGVDGVVVPARDPSALADALERLLTDVDLRREQGQAARLDAHERFDVDATIDAVREQYALARG